MIQLDSVDLSLGGKSILKKFDMRISPGEHIAIMGPSGCGKTSLLRLISGLIKPDRGSVSVNGVVSCVFQEPRLLPWMNALDNIRTVLEASPNAQEQAMHLLELTGLENAAHKYPSQLSGGMQQRVSIARALAYGGDILLLDEPLKGLDSELCSRISALISKAAKDKTLILISHDLPQAKELADSIFTYRDGGFYAGEKAM